MADLLLIGAQVDAARGDMAALARWLREDNPLSREDKAFIADLLEGKIKKPPKKKGRPRRRLGQYTWLELVAMQYREIAEWLRRRGKLYGNGQRLIDALAAKYEVDASALANEINRGPDHHWRRRKPTRK